MKVITNGFINTQYKVYKMCESVEGKIYIGKTKLPIYMRINAHKHSNASADIHFSDVGWNNVTTEIIDEAKDEEELDYKEKEHINNYYRTHKDLLLIKNTLNCIDFWKNKKQMKINTEMKNVLLFIKTNRYIIKNVSGARVYICECVKKFKKNELSNDDARSQIIEFFKTKSWNCKYLKE